MSAKIYFPLIFCSSMAMAQVMSPVAVKEVAAPPSDIESGMVRLPDPALVGVGSHSAMIPVELAFVDGVWSWSMPITVGQRGAKIAFLEGQQGDWAATMVTPAGLVVREQIDNRAGDGVEGATEISREGLVWVAPDRGFLCMRTAAGNAGNWTINITGNGPGSGFVMVDSGTDAELYTYVTESSVLVGKPITLRSDVSGGLIIQRIEGDIRTPGGERVPQRMGAQNTDVVFIAREPGDYSVRVLAHCVDKDGRRVLLSTQHLIHAEVPSPALGDVVLSEQSDARIGLRFSPDPTARRTIVGAEVWGEREGEMVPVCWLSRVCSTTRELGLDPRWLALAGVDAATIELRQIRVHDIDSMVPIEIIDSMPVGEITVDISDASVVLADSMLQGRPGVVVDSPLNVSATRGSLPGHRLMLVHGYCTDSNPYPVSHFTGDLAVFEDFNQSRSQDAFALELLAQSSPMKSFGVVAHSQGGLASLHLSTFYWSGLDWSQGERLIQSVGSPYQGTALAGNAAVLGDLFGFGCGVNNSLSYSGAANWLSTIPSWARARVWYWTTSFEDRPFVYDYCNIITDLLLSDPDDGVIERSAGQLSGANSMGHTDDWCHTTGMRDPAQCTDSGRNAEMNQRARR
jgi:hypothetical protein